jgi:hypothetical protein
MSHMSRDIRVTVVLLSLETPATGRGLVVGCASSRSDRRVTLISAAEPTKTPAILAMATRSTLSTVRWSNPAAMGTVGLAGYLTASLGRVLVAGDWWYEAFIGPALRAQAPGVVATAPSGEPAAPRIALTA